MTTARAGDESAFADPAERYRRELRVHCYRMLGSFEESEDLAQETFLRAWRGLGGFEGRFTFRAWLYRIATNACLDFLERHPRRPVLREGVREPSDIAWLQPYPDRLLASPADEPDTVAVARETIELAFLAAIQHLPPRSGSAARHLPSVSGDGVTTLDTLPEGFGGVSRPRACLRPSNHREFVTSPSPTAAPPPLPRGEDSRPAIRRLG